MKKVLFYCTIFLANLQTSAQLYISPALGYHKESIKPEGFNQFFESWNNHYSAGIKKPFDEMNGMAFSGVEYGIDLVKMPDKKSGFYFRRD